MTDEPSRTTAGGAFAPPESVNNLYTNKFRLVFLKIPTTTFFCTDAALPDLSLNSIPITTPFNPHFVGDTSVTYSDLTVRFQVDEDLKNYKEIHKWMVGIASPERYPQFTDLINSNTPSGTSTGYHIYSDARLLTLKNSHLYNLSIVFRDAFPIRLTGIRFRTGENVVATADATFKYNYYEFEDGLA